MVQYRLEDFLNQELPDRILIDMAFRLHANDNNQFSIRSPGRRPSGPSSVRAAERSFPTLPL
jgi:hypothetical protein